MLHFGRQIRIYNYILIYLSYHIYFIEGYNIIDVVNNNKPLVTHGNREYPREVKSTLNEVEKLKDSISSDLNRQLERINKYLNTKEKSSFEGDFVIYKLNKNKRRNKRQTLVDDNKAIETNENIDYSREAIETLNDVDNLTGSISGILKRQLKRINKYLNTKEKSSLEDDFVIYKLNRKKRDRSKRKILVKRKVKHSSLPFNNKIHYNPEQKVFYKPLYRLHKTKELKERRHPSENKKMIFLNDLGFPIQKQHKSQFKSRELNKELDKERFNKNYRDVFDDISPSEAEIIRHVIHDIRKLDKQNQLRSEFIYDQSKERDPVISSSQVTSGEEGPKLKELALPHYSIWNYWTYQKEIVQDECPGYQVKVSGVCVWAPPH